MDKISIMYSSIAKSAIWLLDLLVISETTAHMLLDMLQFLFIVKLLRGVFSYNFSKSYDHLTQRDFHCMFGDNWWSDFLYCIYHCQFDLNGRFSVVCSLIMKLSEGIGKLSLHKWMSSILIPASVQAVGNWILLVSVLVLAVSVIAGVVDDYIISPRLAKMKAIDVRPQALIDHTDRVLCQEIHRLHPGLSSHISASQPLVARIPTQGLRGYWLQRDYQFAYHTLQFKLRKFGKYIKNKYDRLSCPPLGFSNAFESLSRVGYAFAKTSPVLTRPSSTPNMHFSEVRRCPQTIPNGGVEDPFTRNQGNHDFVASLQRSASPFFNLFRLSPQHNIDADTGVAENHGSVHGQSSLSTRSSTIQSIREAADHIKSRLQSSPFCHSVFDHREQENLDHLHKQIFASSTCLDTMNHGYEFFRTIHNKVFPIGKLDAFKLPNHVPSGMKQVRNDLTWILKMLPSVFPNHGKYSMVRHFIEDRCLPVLCLFYNLDVHDQVKFSSKSKSGQPNGTMTSLQYAVMHSHHARMIKIIIELIRQQHSLTPSSNGIADRLLNLLSDVNVSQSDDVNQLASCLDLPLRFSDQVHSDKDYGCQFDFDQLPGCLKRYALYLEKSFSPEDALKRESCNLESGFIPSDAYFFKPI